MSLFDYLKNIFFVLLILQFLPPMIMGIKKQYGQYLEQKEQVGVISMTSELASSARYNKQLNTFFKDDAIKAIVLRMDCGGGAAGTSKAIYDEIMALKKEYKKPIITLVENTCASGAYYIACATDYIIAPSMALIGNIGTAIPLYPQINKLLDLAHVTQENISAGSHKMAGSPLIALTDKQREHLLNVTQDSYQQFIEDVAQQRKLSLTQHQEWADGKVFTARQGVKLGLIDAVGSAQDAIKIITQKAMISGTIEWVHPPKESAMSQLFGGTQEEGESSLFTEIVENIYNHMTMRNAKPQLTA